jgi:hypothetical protein
MDRNDLALALLEIGVETDHDIVTPPTLAQVHAPCLPLHDTATHWYLGQHPSSGGHMWKSKASLEF